MQTVTDLVVAVRNLYGSDNKAAPHIGVSQNTFTRWRNGEDFPRDEHALKIAELLELDAAYVLAIIRHDRAQSDDARKAWRRVAKQFAKAAAVAVIAITGAGTPPPSGGNAAVPSEVCVLCKKPRRPKSPDWAAPLRALAQLLAGPRPA